MNNTINEKEWKRDDCQRLPLDATFPPDPKTLKRLAAVRDELRRSKKGLLDGKRWK